MKIKDDVTLQDVRRYGDLLNRRDWQILSMLIQGTILQDVLITKVWESKAQKKRKNITMYLFVKIAGRLL